MAGNIRALEVNPSPIVAIHGQFSLARLSNTSFKITSDKFINMTSIYNSGRKLTMSINPSFTYQSDSGASASGMDLIHFINGNTSYSSRRLGYSFSVTFTYVIYDTYIIINMVFGNSAYHLSSIASSSYAETSKYPYPFIIL